MSGEGESDALRCTATVVKGGPGGAQFIRRCEISARPGRRLCGTHAAQEDRKNMKRREVGK